MQPGDIIIDGGNSKFSDSQKTGAKLKEKGIGFLDAGTSGGIWGLKEGYCLMVGGEDDTYKTVEPLLLVPCARRRIAAHRAGRVGALREDGA